VRRGVGLRKPRRGFLRGTVLSFDHSGNRNFFTFSFRSPPLGDFLPPFLGPFFFLSCTVVSETTNYYVQAHPSNITLQFATHPRLFSSRIFRYLQLFSFSFLIDPVRFLVGSLGVCFAVCIIDDCCALQPASAYFQLYSSTRHPAATKPLLLPLRLVLLPTLVDRPDTIIRSLLYPRTSSSHAGAVSTSAPCVLI
jgi:hypothetical protein